MISSKVRRGWKVPYTRYKACSGQTFQFWKIFPACLYKAPLEEDGLDFGCGPSTRNFHLQRRPSLRGITNPLNCLMGVYRGLHRRLLSALLRGILRVHTIACMEQTKHSFYSHPISTPGWRNSFHQIVKLSLFPQPLPVQSFVGAETRNPA